MTIPYLDTNPNRHRNRKNQLRRQRARFERDRIRALCKVAAGAHAVGDYAAAMRAINEALDQEAADAAWRGAAVSAPHADACVKIAYPTRGSARRAASAMGRRVRARLNIYRCSACSLYHLTSQGRDPRR